MTCHVNNGDGAQTVSKQIMMDNRRKRYKRASPRPTPSPRAEEIDFNRTWRPDSHDMAHVYKPWYIIDANEQWLDDVANLAAWVLQGKHLPTYDPYSDMGPFVIISNIQKVRVNAIEFYNRPWKFTFHARPAATYYRSFWWMVSFMPELMMQRTVWEKMKHNYHNKVLLRQKLKLYREAEHPHDESKPIDITWYLHNKQPFERYWKKFGKEAVGTQGIGAIYDTKLQDFTDEPNLFKP